MRTARPVLILLATVFGLGALAGAKLWVDFTWSDASSMAPQALERREHELEKGTSPSSDRLALAERLARTELRFGPQNRGAWCRLAYAQYRRAGRLDAASTESLLRSYQFAPYAPDVFLWRTEFVFDNWSEASPELKTAALRETRAFYGMWAHRPRIELMAARIKDPTGRLALELVLVSAPLPVT